MTGWPITDERATIVIATVGLAALLFVVYYVGRWLDDHYNQGYDPSAERRKAARSSAIVDPDPLYDESLLGPPC
jgi:hypothetical protein